MRLQEKPGCIWKSIVEARESCDMVQIREKSCQLLDLDKLVPKPDAGGLDQHVIYFYKSVLVRNI